MRDGLEMGWLQMSKRGLENAHGEWSVVTMAWHFKRLHLLLAAKNTGPVPPHISTALQRVMGA